jgi:hypothetical protein
LRPAGLESVSSRPGHRVARLIVLGYGGVEWTLA